MLEKNKKKIISLSTRVIAFFKANLAQIIFIMLMVQFATALRSVPYLNVIPNLFYYSIILILFLILLFFRVIIPNKYIIIITLSLFVVTTIFTVVGDKELPDLFGFIIYILLLLTVVREILHNRLLLRQETKK